MLERRLRTFQKRQAWFSLTSPAGTPVLPCSGRLSASSQYEPLTTSPAIHVPGTLLPQGTAIVD